MTENCTPVGRALSTNCNMQLPMTNNILASMTEYRTNNCNNCSLLASIATAGYYRNILFTLSFSPWGLLNCRCRPSCPLLFFSSLSKRRIARCQLQRHNRASVHDRKFHPFCEMGWQESATCQRQWQQLNITDNNFSFKRKNFFYPWLASGIPFPFPVFYFLSFLPSFLPSFFSSFLPAFLPSFLFLSVYFSFPPSIRNRGARVLPWVGQLCRQGNSFLPAFCARLLFSLCVLQFPPFYASQGPTTTRLPSRSMHNKLGAL